MTVAAPERPVRSAPRLDRTWWRSRARCRLGQIDDPEIMSGEGTAAQVRRAKGFCHECPVIAECLTSVLKTEKVFGSQWGIYGGLTEPERRKISPASRLCSVAGCQGRITSSASLSGQYRCSEHI